MQNIGGISYTVDANISGLLKFDKQIDTTERNAVQAFGAIDKAAAQTGQQLNKVAAATQEATGGMNSLRGVAGNLGFQLQDIAVQAQAGTSAFTILGQQGSQIASAFGPGGAVLGAIIAISAAIGGVLVKSLSEATAKAGELPAALEEKLTKIKERLKETDEASKAAFSSVEIAKANAEYERLGALIEGLRKKQESYKKQIQEAASPEIRKNYERLYSDVSDQIEVATKSQRIQALYVEKVTKATLESREGWEGIKEETEKATSEAERLEKQLILAVTKLEEGDLAARRMAAAMILNLKAGEQLPANIDALIKKEFELEQQQKRAAQAKQQWAREAAELQKEIADDERQQAQDDFQAAQRAAQQRADLQSRVADIGLTPEQRQQAQYDRELQLLKQAQEQKLLTEQQYQERLAVLRGQYEQKDGGLFSTLGESLKGLQNQVSGTFAQMALGFEDSDKLAQRLGQTIVTELIGATINWGIQQAIAAATGATATVAAEGTKTAAITGTAAASAAAATSATAAVTSAGVASGAALTAAYAPAAAAASVATAGAAPAAAAPIAISSIGAIMAALVGGVALGKMSGRLYGGPVQAGSLYPVTENGKPELLVQGNRQYLLPGAGGRVVSNKDMQAGGGGVTIYLNPSTTINAIDTQAAAQFIAQNAEAISVAVDKQMQKYGRSNRR